MAKPLDKQEEEIVDRTAPSGEVVYHAIYREGEHELHRNSVELAFSGVAAGLSMGFSMVAEALLQERLPDAAWRPLVSKLGYSVGFLIVILGRQQLFTKNTLTVLLPVLRQKRISLVAQLGRLWTVVLIANLLGAFAFAWAAARAPLFTDIAQAEFARIGEHSVHAGFSVLVVRGIVAGWLIALMVWLLPFAESAHIWVIIIIAYVIGIAELPHVIAGAVEAFYLVAKGTLSFWASLSGYVLPVLIGNVIGGVALVGVAAHTEFIEARQRQ